jgi:hypothetical protein
MLSAGERALLRHFEPLCEAELDRLGISREDQNWIHAGSGVSPTKEGYEGWLTELRALPTGMGVAAYCAYLGFDYVEMKRATALPNRDVV